MGSAVLPCKKKKKQRVRKKRNEGRVEKKKREREKQGREQGKDEEKKRPRSGIGSSRQDI
jgi:hypothetical protein